jgi:hypothetical protein
MNRKTPETVEKHYDRPGLGMKKRHKTTKKTTLIFYENQNTGYILI